MCWSEWDAQNRDLTCMVVSSNVNTQHGLWEWAAKVELNEKSVEMRRPVNKKG